jgi:DNA-binding MarR family transcriptional regulator
MYDGLIACTKNEPYWKLYTAISSINRQVRRISEQALKPLNLTWPQFEVLLQLSLGDNVAQTDLAERLDKDTTTVMVLCDSLEKKGLINRVKDLGDRRVNRIVLNEDSRAITIEACQTLTTVYKATTENISQQTLEKILLELERIYESLQRRSENEVTGTNNI